MIPDDPQLLRQYAEERSEVAFTELVRRHASLVYYSALRRVGGNAHLADDVMQSVFTDLARKASSLKDRAVLTGWLYTSTRFAAAQAVRAEQRRRNHEQEAHTMHELHSTPDSGWEELRPIIDEALDELNERDREVVLLRFFENRPLSEVGAKYLLSPDAARMRVDRALEKLRGLLAKRGIASTSAALTSAFVTQAGLAAPAGLVAKTVAGVLSQTGSAAAVTFGLWKIVTGAVIVSLGTGVIAFQVKQIQPSAAIAPAVVKSEVDQTTVPANDSVVLSSVAPINSAASPVAAIAATVAENRSDMRRTLDDFGWPQVGLFAGDGGEKPSHTIADFRAMMEGDSVFRAAVVRQAKLRLDMFYRPLFTSLDLPEAKLDQFKDLLVEKEVLRIDSVGAQQALSLPVSENRALFREGLDQGQEKVDAEIRTVLGESVNERYLRYREDLVQWTAVNAVALKLQNSATPLTDDQAGKLAVLLRSSLLRVKAPFTFDICYGSGLFSAHIGSALTERVYRQAGEFLAAPQVDALRQLQRHRGD